MIALAIKLVFSHLLGDFLFQPNSWVQDKEIKKYKSVYLYLHIIIHAILLFVILQFKMKYWLGILIISISHFGIDLLKVYLKSKINYRFLFVLDQILHLCIIALVVYYYHRYNIDFGIVYNSKTLLFLVFLILTTLVSSIIMKLFISQWNVSEYSTPENSLHKAGTYIGMLERLFIFIFIVTGRWEGIGFLLAAKSVFRYGDLSKAGDRKLTEYILIGTLLSFGLAMLIGITYTYLAQTII
ncbi:uncharacterized protein DUF3307 [Aquimarina sp. MAR_2010_214]|uniref:DUF3307 domain-containing protein n=1 Tax=Aquimarina sp. MAR_2010_214 TaxID=1250026 RepID=UPI000C6FDDDD|nr:DUF3307 domain-containing protein [Aquimarina sp. MAR_2010_214]PKV50943.1 uncharacterized protein DUF3307 [Aquimarina sp. MAR_2010_214]